MSLFGHRLQIAIVIFAMKSKYETFINLTPALLSQKHVDGESVNSYIQNASSNTHTEQF